MKEFADDNFKVDENCKKFSKDMYWRHVKPGLVWERVKGFYDTDCIENFLGKGEMVHFEQIHLFSKCFPKTFFFNVLK